MIKEVINKLLIPGAKSVVITSKFIEGQKQVRGYNGSWNEYFFLPYREIPARFVGTGDIFSIIIGRIPNDQSLENATKSAMRVVEEVIRMNIDNADQYTGIPIETCLKVLEE